MKVTAYWLFLIVLLLTLAQLVVAAEDQKEDINIEATPEVGKEEESKLTTGDKVAIGTAATGATAAAAGGAVTALGFTGSGVAAGSVAAGIQAGLGNVATGSLFAVAQSAAATGVITAVGVVGVVVAVGAGAYLTYSWCRSEQ
jgi:hypothetical protein